MSDSDVLARAAEALRDAHTGERAASGFTRARIMNTLHRERRRRIVRWTVLSPLVSLLLVGSAWAQSSGKWPVIWRAVTAVFSDAPAVPESSRLPERRPPAAEHVERAPSPPEPPPVDDPQPSPELAPATPPEPSGLPPRHPRPRLPRPAPRVRTVDPAPVEAPAAARELGLFRAAHDLHFRGDRPREAIAAYDAYLREYPRGRFVPEARYNAALDHIKLGERAAAREALTAFADGDYGGYRQKEARELLDALR